MSYVEYPVSSSSGWLDAEDADKGFTGPLFFSAGTSFTGAAAQAPGNRTWRRLAPVCGGSAGQRDDDGRWVLPINLSGG